MEIRIQNWSKSFGGHLLFKNVNVTFQEGGRFCLMGASGSGKTTFLRMLAGLEKPDSGTSIGLEGRMVSMVFQENRLCESFSALDNIRMVLKKTQEKDIRRELGRILPVDYIDKPTSCFSGGMKRRVALARALLANSELLLLDEPFTGLDEEMKKQIIAYILERQKGRTLSLIHISEPTRH